MNEDDEMLAEAARLEREMEEKQAALRNEMAPIVEELNAEFGYDLTTLSLVRGDHKGNGVPRFDYSAALPTIIRHLQDDHTYLVVRELADALVATRNHEQVWKPIRERFEAITDTRSNGPKWALGCALADLLDKDHVDQVVAIVADQRHGRCRAPLVEALGRFRRRERVRAALAGLLTDEDVSDVARKALGKLASK